MSKPKQMRLSNGSGSSSQSSRKRELSPALLEAKETDPIQWNLQCDIARAAYELTLKDGSQIAIEYMEELMDLYGLERGISQ